MLSEGTFRIEELARLRVSVRQALVVENDATFLAVPVHQDRWVPEAGAMRRLDPSCTSPDVAGPGRVRR